MGVEGGPKKLLPSVSSKEMHLETPLSIKHLYIHTPSTDWQPASQQVSSVAGRAERSRHDFPSKCRWSGGSVSGAPLTRHLHFPGLEQQTLSKQFCRFLGRLRQKRVQRGSHLLDSIYDQHPPQHPMKNKILTRVYIRMNERTHKLKHFFKKVYSPTCHIRGEEL